MPAPKKLSEAVAKLSKIDKLVLAPIAKEDFDAYDKGKLRYSWQTERKHSTTQ